QAKGEEYGPLHRGVKRSPTTLAEETQRTCDLADPLTSRRPRTPAPIRWARSSPLHARKSRPHQRRSDHQRPPRRLKPGHQEKNRPTHPHLRTLWFWTHQHKKATIVRR